MSLFSKILHVCHGGPQKYDEHMRYNDKVEALRRKEYPMLHGLTYLDHAGTTVPSKSLIKAFSKQIQVHLIANPHSSSVSTPSLSQTITHSTRLSILKLFNANPDHFEVVFVANATAAIKLVLEAFRDLDQGFDYYYHRDCHTSLVGVRELATKSHCFTLDKEVEQWLVQEKGKENQEQERLTLFAYPAQSNMNGRRLPLSWPSALRGSGRRNTFTLLDIAASISTTPFDLSDHAAAPDFLSLSFNKIYGFPNLGALIVRKPAAHVFDNRRYFGGGTTEMITCIEKPWFSWKQNTLSARLEDGTGPIHSIFALKCAIEVHNKMYGGLAEVSKHTTWLASQLYHRLNGLRHTNGRPVCRIYKDPASIYGDPKTQGATVAFNIIDQKGVWLGSSMVGNLAMAKNIHLRSGGLCNPGGMAHALGLSADDIRTAYDSGYRCGQDIDWMLFPFGMVRASLGACSTLRDVDILVQFIADSFIDIILSEIGEISE